MKKYLLLVFLLLIFLLKAESPEPGLLLHSSFDKFTTVPDYAANQQTKTGGIPYELQMRMYNDPQDKLNAVNLNNQEFLQYTHTDNFNPQCGTISLWVKPINWKMGDNHYFQTFFEVRAIGIFRLILNKDINGDYLNATMIIDKKSYTVSLNSKWQTGEWHKIDFVWNSSNMKLYVDGRPPMPGSRGEMIFAENPDLPASIRWATMRLNFFDGWKTNPEWSTAYDDLKIYNRMLSPAEILAAYEKKIPPQKTISKLLLNSPGTVPVASPLPCNKSSGEFNSTVKVTHDKEKLYLDYIIDNPGNKYNINTRDGELWLNDSVEFHVTGNDGKSRQFIVNPAGALYDAMEGDLKWNSQAVAKAERLGKKWRAHLAIPLADLGGGTSFQVNFGITDSGSPYKSYTWNELYGNVGFSESRFFGTLNLGEPAAQVELFSLGNLQAGKLNVSAEAAPGVRMETEYKMMSGISGKGNQMTLPEGKADIYFRAFQADGRLVAFYHRTAIINPPLTLSAAGLSQQNQIECRLDFSASGMTRGDGSLQLKSEKGDKVYASKKFFADKPEYTVILPLTEKLPENTTYKIIATVGSFATECQFKIPDMTPFKNTMARNHVVPSPWNPVSVSGKDIKVLDRVYTFDKSPLPSQIVSRGNKIFTAAPQFVLNGQPIQWDEAKIGKNYGDYVDISAAGKFDGGAAKINGKLWFDGMYQFDLQLIPATSLQINSMQLLWRTPRDMAKYAMATAFTPWENEQIKLKWDPREYNSLFWLSGHKSGLAWWCKSDANWIIDPNRYNIIAKRTELEVNVSIDMFAAPAKLDKTAEYTMIFQATPPKRPDNSFREWGLGTHWFKDSDCVFVGGHSGSGRVAPDNITNWISLLPVDMQKFRGQMQKLHKQNLKTRLYGMPTHISKLDAEYDWFFKTCAIKPSVIWQAKDEITGKNYVVEPCCANTSIGDLHIFRIDELFKNVPELDGIYFDIMHIKNCNNELHGCGGVDAFGKRYTTSIALNLRDYTLRVLKTCQKYNRMFWLHAHNAFFPFVHDLADNWMPGEELFSAIEKNPEWGYLEVISPEAYQSAWNSEVRGMSISNTLQLERVTQILDLPKSKKDAMRSDEYAIHALAPSMLYDFMVVALGSESQENPTFKLWRIRKALKFNEADFHGYWIEPIASSAPQVKTSWYSWSKDAPHPFLLCVVNTDRQPIKTELKIDWKKLNIEPVSLIDIWSGRTFSEKELAEYTLKGHNFMLLVPQNKGEK